MEEGKTNKLYITFVLDVPDNAEKSDFNTLVLRLDKLRRSIIIKDNDELSLKFNNHNVTEMQKLLENFKYKEVEEV